MDTVIIYRVGAEGQLLPVLDGEGDVAVFADHKAAEDYADRNPLFTSGQASYQLVDIDI